MLLERSDFLELTTLLASCSPTWPLTTCRLSHRTCCKAHVLIALIDRYHRLTTWNDLRRLRFLKIDVLDAAGSSASVASRVGDEPETILRRVHLNNTLLSFMDTLREPTTDTTVTGNEDSSYYNTSSAGIIILMLASALALLFFWRRRLRRAGSGDFAQGSATSNAITDDRTTGGKFMRVPTEEVDGSSSHGHELEELVVDDQSHSSAYYDVVKHGGSKGKEKSEL